MPAAVRDSVNPCVAAAFPAAQNRVANGGEYGTISATICDSADFANASARAALPPVERTAGDQHHLRARDLSGTATPSPAGAALYAAHPFRHPRSRAHHAAAPAGDGVAVPD